MPARPLFRRHDPASQARYQDLKQLAGSQARVLSGTPGTLKQRTQSGKKYWVREHIRVNGSKADEYLGAESAIDHSRIAALRAEIELARALASGSAQLRLLGYQRIERKPAAVLEVLFNRRLTRAGLTLVGSHAYGALLNELGILAPVYRTRDVDLARAQPLAIALDNQGALQYVDEAGTVFPIHELSAHAQSIPLLQFLIDEPLDSVVLSPNQVIPVKLPSPARFLLHKLYASQSRRTNRDKVRKDLEQAAVLAAAIEEDTPGAISDAFRRMSASGKPASRRGARAAARILTGMHPEAEAALLKLAGK